MTMALKEQSASKCKKCQQAREREGERESGSTTERVLQFLLLQHSLRERTLQMT